MDAPADSSPPRARRRRGILAIVALALAWATVMQPLGWTQTSEYSLVRALSHGTAGIDRYHWETGDDSYHRGHYYSVKAPGLAVLTLPLYETLRAARAKDAARWLAETAHRSGAFRWYRASVRISLHVNDAQLAHRVRVDTENYTPLVWMLGLLGTVMPAMLMLLLVRSLAERLEPGLGTAAAISLGAGTLVMPFATLFFSHVLSAMLAFASFALLWRERQEPSRPRLVAGAGLLAGLAVTTEYPLAIAGAILGIYAISRGEYVRRGLTYAAGVIAGVAPLALYNLWAFGSVTHFSYSGAVEEQGITGHDVLGLNDSGLFGVKAPSLNTAVDLLFSSKGLLVLSPVLIMGLVGTVLLHRRGRRAESLVIAGTFLAFLVYNSAYWLPFGGDSPGPRFLIPVLPFLAVPLALAYRRFPATTLVLAIPSVLTMVAATMTLPMIGNGDTGVWVHLIDIGNFEHTIASALGAGNGWLSETPFLAAIVTALVLAARATGSLGFSRDATLGALAVVAWELLAALTPRVPAIGSGSAHSVLAPVVIAGTASLVALSIALVAERRPWAPRVGQGSDAAP